METDALERSFEIDRVAGVTTLGEVTARDVRNPLGG
jgi:hypothetical protein